MPCGKEIPQSDKGAIVALSEEGLSLRTIAKRTGYDHSTVKYFLRRYKKSKSFDSKPRSGRPRATTSAQDKVLEKLSLADRQKSASQLNGEWRKKCRVVVSRQLVNLRLLAANLPARTPRRKSLKTEVIKAKRLQFALDHRDWSVDDWKRVCFTDETWMQIRENGRLQFVRRRPGEAFLPQCCISTTKHPLK